MASAATTAAPDAAQTARAAPVSSAVRLFGRFQLLRLLGKSERTMAWAAMDTRSQQDCALVLPRRQPADDAAAAAWRQAVQRASRLNHPGLAPALEIGEHERWPYAMYDRRSHATWAERFSSQGLPPLELAAWSAQIAQALAYAHEAGVAHGDVQPWLLVVDEAGSASLMGLEVAGVEALASPGDAAQERRAVREAGERDVLGLGLVMHHALCGKPALDEPDTGRVIERMPPVGHEIVRLPWALARPIPDPLRAIVNRATDRQERHRYRNARTLQKAVEGWLRTQSEQDGGPLALLLDRIQAAGVLPAQPGGAERVAHLALMDRCRTSELAEVVLSDIALSLELVRQVNASGASSDGPVLMLRRAIAMLGVEGVRRAALALRPWPGPMNETGAAEMERLVRRVHRIGRLAVRLVPAGYDSEVIYLVAMLQNLGRLVVQYHFPDEAQQIRRLMLPIEPSVAGQPAQPGLSAEAASFAVLGVDVEELGVAVARHWGLDESVLHMMRRVAATEGHRAVESDGELLRHAASCANDLADAAGLPPQRAQLAFKQAAQRYARVLGLGVKELQEAMQAESQAGAAAPLPERTPGPPAAAASGVSPSQPGAPAAA